MSAALFCVTDSIDITSPPTSVVVPVKEAVVAPSATVTVPKSTPFFLVLNVAVPPDGAVVANPRCSRTFAAVISYGRVIATLATIVASGKTPWKENGSSLLVLASI